MKETPVNRDIAIIPERTHILLVEDEVLIPVEIKRRIGALGYQCELIHNGPGVPESVEIENPSGFGLTMIQAMAAQLDGSVRYQRLADAEPRGMRAVATFLHRKQGEAHQ